VAMVERIGNRLGLTSLRYQRLPDLIQAIGLPKEKVCTYCWNGAESCVSCPKSRTTQEKESVPAQPK
jgi:glutamine phosphoribosylpyrophosphate amidotransferase